MSKHYEKNAKQVVKGFKEVLDDEVRKVLTDDDYYKLAMLIESALTNSVLSAVEKVADDLEKSVRKIRRGAEHYDD
jgi:vacuolar-type H+-ATPase subunit E/Vma4